MPKIPTVVKFTGDNDSGFDLWCAQFEAQLKALGIKDEQNKWRDLLLCCTDGSAFAYASQAIVASADISYVNLKKSMKERFCGDDYKRNLQAKLQNLRFRKGTKIIPFVHELRMTVRELYSITGEEAIEGIATSHVMATLDDHVKKHVQVLQLAGNTGLENLLELVDSLLSGNPLSLSAAKMGKDNSVDNPATGAYATAATETVSYDKRLGRLETMFEKLMTKLDNPAPRAQRSEAVCEHCKKKGHTRERCFKLKKCYKCGEIGHISKYCKAVDVDTNKIMPQSGNCQEAPDGVEPGNRLVIKVKVGSDRIDFLYDTGSQNSVIPRHVYDSLQVKPPLIPMKRSGIGITENKFQFDGVVYLNLELQQTDGSLYILEYEPVLVSPSVVTSTFGIKAEQRFEEIKRKQRDRTLTFVTEDKQEIIIPFYREHNIKASAFIKVAKVTVVNDGEMRFLKAKLDNPGKLKAPIIYENLNFDNTDIEIGDYVSHEVKKTIKLPVYNYSGQSVKFKKGDILGVATEIEPARDEIPTMNAVQTQVDDNQLDFEAINHGDVNPEELTKFRAILTKYDTKVRKIPESQPLNYPLSTNLH